MKALIGRGNLHDSEIQIPSSKSHAHRVLISAALAPGVSHIHNLVLSDDIEATIDCLRMLGAVIDIDGHDCTVKGIEDFNGYDGDIINCREAGSTLRFMIPLFTLSGKTVTFTGRGRLMKRPQSVYEHLFERFEYIGDVLRVKGRLSPGYYEIPGDVSSQFITGLLFVLPLLEADSVIEIVPPFESQSYVDLTVQTLKAAGIELEKDGLVIKVKGNQKYQPIDISIVGDDSQAAFFAVAGAISGKKITVQGMSPSSIQGDHIIVEYLKQCGCMVEEFNTAYSFKGEKNMKAGIFDMANCPDLGPVMFVLAAFMSGMTVFRHTRRLRIKESDRVRCMLEELDKLGVRSEYDEDSVTIWGGITACDDMVFDGHNDHRIVMALAIMALGLDKDIIINGAEAVNKSYPAFFEDLRKTGAKVELYDKQNQ